MDEFSDMVGGVMTKVRIAGKTYVLYVKYKGEFMTVRQAMKLAKADEKAKSAKTVKPTSRKTASEKKRV